jgi:hypothetical protein
MFCPGCGKEVPADSQFCPSCGHAVASNSASEVAPSKPPHAAPSGSSGFFGWLRNLKTWKKVLIGLFVFIVSIVTLAMCMTSGLQEPVEHHFSAIHAGDLTLAYSDLSIATRHDVSEADFKAMLERNPALTHVTGMSFSSRSYNGDQGTVEGTLNIDGGGKLPITVRLVKENDEWKILSYHVTPAQTQQ